MTRNVICNIINLTGQQFYVDNTQTNVWNGEDNKGGVAPQTIGSGTSSQQIFYYHKTTGGLVGVTGSVFYMLGNNASLQLAFNNPYTQQIPSNASPSFLDCFFYAGIVGISESNPPAFNVSCSVSLDGNAWSPSYKSEVKTMTATITISNNS